MSAYNTTEETDANGVSWVVTKDANGNVLHRGKADVPAAPTAVNLPYFQEDRDRLGGMLQGQSPFASGDWNDVINQLKMRASGQGPSLAAMQYQQAMGDTSGALSGMAHGGSSPASFRAAAQQMGQAGQGMAAGSAIAKTNEMNQAQGQLTSALGSRDQLNQGAYLDLLGKQLGLSAEQLRALQGNQSSNFQQQQLQQQNDAAQYAAISGLIGAGATVVGGPAGGAIAGAALNAGKPKVQHGPPGSGY